MLSNFFTSLADGLTSFASSAITMIVDIFEGLFLVTGEAGAVTGLTPIAEIGIAFLAIAMVYKFLPVVLSWFRLGSKGKRRARKATAK